MSQGITMEAMAFDPAGVRQHGLTYTTLSRTKTIDSLFLLKPLTSKKFKIKDRIHLEMSHLQSSAQWKFENDDTCSHNTPSMLLCTLNTHSLKPHINDITNN